MHILEISLHKINVIVKIIQTKLASKRLKKKKLNSNLVLLLSSDKKAFIKDSKFHRWIKTLQIQINCNYK